MKYLFKFLVLFVFVIFFSTECFCQNKIYIGWFNDDNRSVAGQGCWEGVSYYDSCGYEFLPCGRVEGWWGVGESWLWVYTGEIEISEIDFAYMWNEDVRMPDGCMEEGTNMYWNFETVSEHSGMILPRLPYTYQDVHVSLNKCMKGWFWIFHLRMERIGGWRITMDTSPPPYGSAEATLCDDGASKKPMAIFSHYVLNPVILDEWSGEPSIGNANSTWGAIKLLYK